MRERLGYKKHRTNYVKNKPVDFDDPAVQDNLDRVMSTADSKVQRKEIARKIFLQSNDYKRLGKQFSDEEIETYVERFTDYLSDWKKILPQEKDQLHSVIKETILQDRFLRRMKQNDMIKESISNLVIENARIMDKSPSLRSEIEICRLKEIKAQILDFKTSLEPSEYILKNYNESVERSQKTLKSLDMTREQRLKRDSETELTFINVVHQLNDPKIRKEIGEKASLLASASHKFKEDAKRTNIMLGEF